MADFWKPLNWVERGGRRHLDDTPRNADVLVAIASYPDDYGSWQWIKDRAHCDSHGIPRTSYCWAGEIRYWAQMPDDPPRDVIDKELATERAEREDRIENDERELLAALQAKYLDHASQ